jgi:lambda family phage portal protein
MGSPMTDTKPRIRVKAGSVAFPGAAPARGERREKATARWLRDTPSGVLSMRLTSLVDSREDTRRAWDRVAALAVDFIQNSGRLKGAVDQILADTVGTELKLNVRPDFTGLGYSAEEASTWSRLVERRWRQWAWNPAECDLRGKFTIPQIVDIALRHHIAYGEACGVMDWLSPTQRRRYGIETGTKVCLISPHRMVRDSNEFEGLFMGVTHDANGRPTHYRFTEREGGLEVKRDYAAFDREGRPQVFHVFDPIDADDVRGISVMASAMRTYASSEKLADVTLATAIMQTIFAATLVSPEPSADAYQALEAIADLNEDLGDEFAAYFGAVLDKARASKLTVDGNTQVSHLAPGEELKLHTAGTPHNNYLPFSKDLLRELARCLGVTYESLSMDHVGATYSSVRMSNASMWPVVMRRRERIAAPICQTIYENWLDEEIGSRRIPFKGGYEAFAANRNRVCWTEWQGPAKPTADDKKSAQAATERLTNGTTDLSYECAELGLDVNDVLAKRAEQLKQVEKLGLPNPFEKKGAGAAADDEPAEPARTAA